MKIPNLFIFSLALAVQCSFAEVTTDLDGTWILQVENLQHKVITTARIRFTDEKSSSCLGGIWKQVIVGSEKSSDMKFFPIKEKLSYMLENGTITIGRNEICDAYLEVGGSLSNGAAAGEYYQLGWGRKKIGYFTLKRSGR